jgi:hypothetical protein
MVVDLNDPYQAALFEAVKAVYDRHDTFDPLYMVNVSEWVEAVKPVIKNIVQEELTNALHPEFGWYHLENEK